MKCSEYIAKFLKAIGSNNIFVFSGGACAHMIDAVAREDGMTYTCFQHEQAASFAADAVWRTSGKLGVTMVTSGPGASNLITGIASSYYDSIPVLHITGQVTDREKNFFHGVKVRQAGFQQMDIVEIIKPISKYAVAVHTPQELRIELKRCVEEAFSGRMGPVIIDIPRDLQDQDIDCEELLLPVMEKTTGNNHDNVRQKIQEFFNTAKRPLVIFGAGVGLSASHEYLSQWLENTGVPFVSTWNAIHYFKHTNKSYVGHMGAYGNRGANFAVQNADKILVLGSRLDNRVKGWIPHKFNPKAELLVLDVDDAEIEKLKEDRSQGLVFDLTFLRDVLPSTDSIFLGESWKNYIKSLKIKYFGKTSSTYGDVNNLLSPYSVLEKIQKHTADNAVFVVDAGNNHCWTFQSFSKSSDQILITSNGHFAMGYSLPASIGSALYCPSRQHISINGDGGVQLNLQELQTIVENDLDIKVIIFNNKSLAMIKIFQDVFSQGRYEATEKGIGKPNFEKIAYAYDFEYKKIISLEDINDTIFSPGRKIIEVVIDPTYPIEPSLEFGGWNLQDQKPLMSDQEFQDGNQFVNYVRKK